MSNDAPALTSQRPYLLRAIHEWIGDNGLTPHLLVDAHFPGVHVPPGTARDGKVVLNIAERAVHMLSLGNEYITFNARFGGVPHEVFVPVAAVLAIYARETGEGMALPAEQAATPDADDAAAGTEHEAADVIDESAPKLAPVASTPTDEDEPPPEGPATPPRRGHLRVVK
ncbi:ClpXP protease specificity-enhancing factor [Luteimonas sp. e5]